MIFFYFEGKFDDAVRSKRPVAKSKPIELSAVICKLRRVQMLFKNAIFDSENCEFRKGWSVRSALENETKALILFKGTESLVGPSQSD